ncbi:tetratricopeptide repeat protein [uncultured Roseibium sp.]|uniref:tetratricopeptide repeat protein n=1 Tax=uncultured Roseibium sp. TaxID=1936171 RepID=UPI002623AC13|nr:tetratricopeptide repeat protein [uncultured Roseibium sp.]
MPLSPRFKQVGAYVVLSLSVLVLAGCSSSEERAEEHYKRGLELVEEGELTKASLEFRNALKLDSEHIDALFAFGELQERQGEFQSAYGVYNGVAEQDATHLPSRLKLMYMLLTANQVEQAQKYLDQAIELSPNDPKVLVAKATLQLRNGEREEAEKSAQDAFKADPELTDALVVLASARMAAADPVGALGYLNQAPDSAAKDVGLQVLKLSVLEALNDEEGIEKLFGELVELFPETPQFSQAWVRWYLANGRKDDAERVIRQFAADRPAEDDAQLALVSFVIAQKGQQEARQELENIIKTRNEQGGDAFPLRIALGELLFRSNQHSDAIDSLQAVVSETSDEGQKNQARIMLATILGQTGDMAQAETLVNQVLEDDAKNVDALRLRSNIKISRNDNAGAVDDILVALNEAPENARLRTLLASAYERDGSSVLAEEQFARALALDNNSPEVGLPMVRFLLRHGKGEQAERVLDSVRERNPSNREVLTLLAQQRLARRDWVGAQEISDTLRKIDAGDTETADKIAAAALGGLDRHEESIALLQSSATVAGDEQALLPDLIRAYVQAGRQDTAISHLLTVLDETPDNTLARILLGSVYLSQNKVAEAEETFKTATENPDSVLGDTSLAQFYSATNRLEEAEAAIRAGLSKAEDNAALRLMLTTVLQQTQRFDEAIEQYEILFASDPESTIVANDLASLLSERRGDPASLERAFEIAQRFRTSEVPQYLDTLGWIYYLRGEHSSALPLLRNASQSLPNLGLAQFHYGMALAALDQKEQAITSLEKALSLKSYMTEEDMELARATVERLENLATQTQSN